MRILRVCVLALCATHATAFKIVTFGDSWAEYSGNAFTDFCQGAVQINKGIGGTTAEQWTKGQGETNFGEGLKAAGALGPQDVVVFSLGGNDFIPGCTPEKKAALPGKIEAAMDALKTALKNRLGPEGPKWPKLITFGYPKSAHAKEKECPTMESLHPLQGIIEAAAKKKGFQFLGGPETQYVCGGSDTTWAPDSPCFGMCYKGTGTEDTPCYKDTIHLNNRGYCKTIAVPAVQKALGCTAKKYTCDTVSKDLSRTQRWGAMCKSFPCGPGATTPSKPAKPNTPLKSTAPKANSACQDRSSALVKEASENMFKSCAELMTSEFNCHHGVYGKAVQALCPASCKCAAPLCCAMTGTPPPLFADDVTELEESADAVVPEAPLQE